MKTSRIGRLACKIGVLLIILASISAGCSGPTKVESIRLEPREIEEKVTVLGKLEASNPCQVMPKVYGTVEQVFAQEGQEVQAGQPLVKLDSTDLEQALLAAKAGLESIRSMASMMNSLASIPSEISQSLNSVMTSVDTGVAGLFDFAKSIVPAVPEQYRMDLIKAIESSYQDYLASTAQSQIPTLPGVGGASTGAQEASANKAIENAMKDLQAATIAAPVSGTVITPTGGGFSLEGMLSTLMSSFSSLLPAGLSLGSLGSLSGLGSALGGFGLPSGGTLVPGSFIIPGSPIYTIVDLRNMSMVAKVEETDVVKFNVNQIASVSLEAYPEKRFKGMVTKIANTATTDEAGATAFDITIQLDMSDIPLKIGMTGSGDVTVASKKDSIVVPAGAMLEKNGRNYVFKIEGGKAKLTEVETGITTETEVEITRGLSRGDRVITKNVRKLKNGQPVKI
ncbi:MAG: efflux RND transporter periplasmic adaptor subunit [Actinomycetota bacterium]|nr:efflux RND transporter periplasmic adaptor subunit [Actinomycetota bacterium]